MALFAFELHTVTDLGTFERTIALFETEELAREVGESLAGGVFYEVRQVRRPPIYRSMQEWENRAVTEQIARLASMLTPEQIALIRSPAFDANIPSARSG